MPVFALQRGESPLTDVLQLREADARVEVTIHLLATPALRLRHEMADDRF